MKAVHLAIAGYRTGARWAGPVVLSLTLLGMRVVWGYGMYVAGKGKLEHIDKPIAYFTELHIPFPTANAWFISCLECFGGWLLLAGLGSRIIAFLLACDMAVAYLLTEHEALNSLWNDSDPAKFAGAGPFWFLVTALVVLALGPGWFSVDAVLKKFVFRRLTEVETKPAFPVVMHETVKA